MKFEYSVTGKTVEDAYIKARTLYASIGEIVESQVISQGKKGFLGIFGSAPAEIRVTIDDGKEEKKKPEEKKQGKPAQKPAKPQTNEKKEAEKKPQQNNNNNAKAKNEQKPAQPQQNKQNQQSKQPKQNQPKAQKPAQPKKEKAHAEPIKAEDIKVTAAEKKLAMGFIESFIKSIGFDCKVIGDLTENEEGFVSRLVTVEGENASILIGHHGETLDAIQYLANLCLARKSDTDHKEYVKVTVDIEGYRAKREETLRALARKMADKALRQNRNVHLDPMNPYERRIIHSEIQKIEGVSTHSVGYDETRKIVITVDKK